MPENGQKLTTYVADCLQLRADLDLLVADASLEQHSGRDIYYAVDHSVIELFVRPFQESAQVRLFANDEQKTLQAMSLLASERIFLSPHWKPILLPPYAVEFGRFLDWLGVSRLRELASRFRLAIEELERLREKPEYRRMRDIVEHHAAAGVALSAAEQKSIVQFVRNFIDVAAPIRLERVAGPLARLSRLLGERRCIPYEEVLDEQVEPDPAVLSRWYQQLTVERPGKGKHDENANLQDARAMGYVYALNRRLRPRRLCLITPSPVIHRLFEQEYREHWRLVTGHILRHPRQFTGFMHDPETYSGERGVRLRRMDATLYAFLTTVLGSREEVDRVFAASVHTKPKELWRLLRNRHVQPARLLEHQFQSEIKPLWRSSQHWSIYEQLLDEKLEPDPGGLGARELDQLFQLIGRDAGLKERLAEEASRDLIQLERWHQEFVVDFQVKRAEPGEAVMRERLDGHLSEDDISTMLGARLLHAPCMLHFYSNDVAQILDVKGFEPLPSERWLKLFDGELTYERLLALAYAMAALNKWDIAENFGELARLAWTPELGIGKQEALYLLAVCKRHGQRSPEMHKDAFDLLREADDERWRALPETRSHPDPRFMRERAAQIFAWHVRRQRKLNEAEWRDSKPPPLEEAFRYSEQALALVGDNGLLRAQLLNNLCFQHLSEGRLEKARGYGQELTQILYSLEPDRREWPPPILDTVHQLRLADTEGVTPDEINEILADYRAINLAMLEFEQREEITQRIAEIGELLAARSEPAQVG